MDKKTIIAVAIAISIVGLGMLIQNRFFNNEEPVNITENQVIEETETVEETTDEEIINSNDLVFNAVGDSPSARKITVDNDVIQAVIDTRGAVIESFLLKEHREKDGNPVDMIFDFGTESKAFEVLSGGVNGNPVDDTFEYESNSTGLIHTFSRDFTVIMEDGSESAPFEMIKEYRFYPDEYLFELKITFKNSVNEELPFDETAYTLVYGPQIGPEFARLDKRGRIEFRKYFTYYNDKKHQEKVKDDEIYLVEEERISWAAIAGKYFSLIAILDETPYNVYFSSIPTDTMESPSQMFFTRPSIKSSLNTDVFRFYFGPNIKDELARYNNDAKNNSGLYDMDFDSIVGGFLSFLEKPLKWVLEQLFKLVHNWGVAIILLTVIIKALLFPITHKTYESTSKMQAIQPKVKEVQEKYKDNPQKLNKELADLYKKEGVNPMSGCLPMLLQMPILIALFGVLNKYFALRGAVFIPGWIDDLSVPDVVWSFNTIKIFSWEISELHLLPIIYLIIQIFTTTVTQGVQAKAQGNNMQTKMMTYGMPIMFFFLFYNMPSGLLIYWTMTNLLTLVQQLITNYLKNKKKISV